jgi:hypothetical protein
MALVAQPHTDGRRN